MITTLFVLSALLVLLLEGTLFLRLLEGAAPVLGKIERLAWGFLAGGSLSSYLFFWIIFLLRLPVTPGVFAVLHGGLLCSLLLAHMYKRWKWPLLDSSRTDCAAALWCGAHSKRTITWWGKLLFAWIILWTAVKIAMGGYNLLVTPVYYNDVYASWNMRAKVFFTEKSLLLDRPADDEFFFGGRVPSYPLTVSFTKIWLASAATSLTSDSGAAGGWSESAVNSIHLLWFLSLIIAFFAGLKREAGILWSTIGTFILVSLPLVLVHGTSAYTDVLMGGHLFVVVYALYKWSGGGLVNDQTPMTNDQRRVWLLLFSVMTAAMVFVKNEAILIFVPPLVLMLFILCERWKRRKDFWIWIMTVAIVAIPWTLFKFAHGLTFGNASEVSSFSLAPNPAVLPAISGDLLYTGSYLLFFPLFLLLLFLGWHFWRRHVLGFLVLFLIIVFFGEIGIYWLTPLFTEAIRHTGFGRGMVHLLPLGVFVSVMMLQWICTSNTEENSINPTSFPEGKK